MAEATTTDPPRFRWGRAGPAAAAALLMLAVAFRDVDLVRMGAILKSVRYEPLLLAVALDAGVFLVKSLKWRYIFAPVRRLPLSLFFSAIAVGTMSSTVLPFRLDELVRTFYLGIKGGLPKATVLGTIVVERFVDVTVLAAASGLVFLALPVPHVLARAAGLGALAFSAAAVLALTAFGGRPWIAGLGARLAARRGTLAQLGEGLLHGLSVLPRPGRVAGVYAFALAEWAVTILYMRTVLRAFDLELPLVGLVLLVATGYASFALPLAPGALGVFELLVKGSLAAGFAVGADVAMSCALTLHVLLVVPISLAGAAVLFKDGLSIGGLRALGSAPAVSSDGLR